jgi:predicted  nucleic acid-binding Zn-ribbon protein
MKVNLLCIYGNSHPGENPHELEDDIANKLINEGLASEYNGRASGDESRKQLEELAAENEDLNKQLEALKIENDELRKQLEALAAVKTQAKK